MSTELLALGAVAFLGYQSYCAYKQPPIPEAKKATSHQRWITHAENAPFSNGAKQPIQGVKKVGPSAYVVTFMPGHKTTIHTHDIDRHIADRYYVPAKKGKKRGPRGAHIVY